MAKVTMEAHGRFGQMLATAVERKGISLRELAEKIGYTYEQMRKIWLGTSVPSPLLLKELAKHLDINVAEATATANADRMERRYGKGVFATVGRDPRLADIEDLLPQLSQQEWDSFVMQMRGYVHQRRKTQ